MGCAMADTSAPEMSAVAVPTEDVRTYWLTNFLSPYGDVHWERIRAHAKHSRTGRSAEQMTPDDGAWFAVLTEEVGEVARALCDRQPLDELRGELVQVAAMACAWISAIDRVRDGQ